MVAHDQTVTFYYVKFVQCIYVVSFQTVMSRSYHTNFIMKHIRMTDCQNGITSLHVHGSYVCIATHSNY